MSRLDRSSIERALAAGGLQLPADADVEITGADPFFPAPLHLGEGAAIAIALTGVGARNLWRLRTGRTQKVAVDVRHAAAALMSFAHLRLPDRDPDALASRERGGLYAIHECRDGRFVHLHGSYRDTPAILSLLGLPPNEGPADIAEVAAAVKQWNALELEDALIEAGLCGGMIRTEAEWAKHPQGRDLASRPLVEVIKVGDAPPQPLPEGQRPLSGVRVLDLTHVLAGPTVSRTLAEHGADVLHISWPDAPKVHMSTAFDIDTAQGKRQAHLDLNDPTQRTRLLALVAGTDVFVQGYQKGSLARRGLGVEELVDLRPGLIYVSENCYGHEGPWAERPGWEQMAQVATGVCAALTRDGRPHPAGMGMNDYTTGYLGAYGAMVALHRRATEGGSWHVRVSLSRTSMWYMQLGADLDPATAPGLGDVSDLCAEWDESAFGRMRYLRPPLHMSETMPHWATPPTPEGSQQPMWIPREHAAVRST